MERNQEQQQTEKKPETDNNEDKKISIEEEGLPKDSPYLNYKDLEDYKQKGYGTQGHLPPEAGRGPGATDAPTLSGASALSSNDAADVASATDAINRHGVP